MNNTEFEHKDIKFIGKIASKIYRRGNIYITEKFKPYQLNYIQVMCLVTLYIQNGITQESIIEDIGIDKASVNRTIKSLEEKEFITKKRNENDKRAINLYLTSKALTFQKICWDILSNWELSISEGIKTEEKEIAFKVMKKMASNAEKIYKGKN